MYSMLIFLVYPIWAVNCEIHSLTYIYTAFSKPVNLPGIHEFTAMGLLDDRMIDYYDSSIKKKVPKQPWMEERLEKDYWDKGTDSRRSKEQWFKVNLGILRDRMRHHNDTGLHILQWRHGCTAEKKDGDDQTIKFISGRDEYSYDGNDFLAFDDNNKRWIAPVDLAVPTKRKWDEVKMLNDYTQGYLERECVNWLSKFVDYGQQQLKQSIPPELYVYSKKNRNPDFLTLHCMATGFLPKEVTMNIMRDGRVVDKADGLKTTGVRPNGDGTYQIMNQVEILRSDTARYQCEVIHPASNMHKIEEWDHSVPFEGSGPNSGVIAAAVVAVLLVLVGVAVAVIIYRKKKESKSETSSDSSDTASTGRNRVFGACFLVKCSVKGVDETQPLEDSKDSLTDSGKGSEEEVEETTPLSGGKVEISETDSGKSSVEEVDETKPMTGLSGERKPEEVDKRKEQKVPPELHVYCNKNKDPTFLTLHCLATGFFPKEVTLNIMKDGKVVDQQDGLKTTGVRPSGDGTYQIMHRVEILRCDLAKYTCEVIDPASDMHKIKEWGSSGGRNLEEVGDGKEQKVPPELHVYCKENKDPALVTLHCLAIGFFPKEVMLNIMRDGKVVDQLNGFETTGVQPNGDGTYQIMHQVEILRSDAARYICEVIHPASDMHKIKEWDSSETSLDSAEGSSSGGSNPESARLLGENCAD